MDAGSRFVFAGKRELDPLASLDRLFFVSTRKFFYLTVSKIKLAFSPVSGKLALEKRFASMLFNMSVFITFTSSGEVVLLRLKSEVPALRAFPALGLFRTRQ